MHQAILDKARACFIRNRNRRRYRRLILAIGCVVVFLTTYALILPAITLEQKSFCGLEEHTHTEACFRQATERFFVCTSAQLSIHSHSTECYNDAGELICGQADYVAHSHNEDCYDTEGKLVCTLEERSTHVHSDACYSTAETEAPVLHVHSEACSTLVKGSLKCEREEYEGHVHVDTCYVPGQELLCTITENHIHGEACYTYPLTCTLSTDPHTHSSSCYGTGSLLCTTVEGHVHTDSCRETRLTCESTEEGHEHSDACYAQVTVCTIPENHSHSSSCYEPVLTCGKAEGEVHVHGTGCFSTEASLICTLEENHVHDSSCYRPELQCQIPEDPGHSHTDDCYEWESVISCGLAEGEPEPTEAAEPVLTCTEPVARIHVHDETCFETVFAESYPICGNTDPDHVHTSDCYTAVCGLEEHTHSLACYSDPEADVESQATWEATMANVTLTGDWHKDVVAIAESQLGYAESTRNYAVWEDNTIHGYTRYGAWYGVPYGDWCGMFVSFCLNYAGVEDMPLNYGVRPWIEDLTTLGLYHSAADHSPIPGELIFYDWEGDGLADHVGIVAEVTAATEHTGASIKAIEGNSSNCVQYVYYVIDDPVIFGYSELPSQLTSEELAQVEAVTAMIAALPTAEEVMDQLLAFEEAEDWEAYEEYFVRIGKEGLTAYNAYSALSERAKAAVTNLDRLMDLEFIWSLATLEETADGRLEAFDNGTISFQYNTQRDAFIYDPAYAQFYNANSPLGTAGSFHIVAFDTAILSAHTNGNILAKNLDASSNNFGTNPKNGVDLVELSYAQNYIGVNSNSAASLDDYLVIGSGNTVALTNNGNSFEVNGTKLDKPNHLIQDDDTSTVPFIDLNRVEAEVKSISANLNSYETSGSAVLEAVTDGEDPHLMLMDPDYIGIYNLTASELVAITANQRGFDMRGFESGRNGSIVINVDCSGWDRGTVLQMPESRVYVDNTRQPLEETLDFSAGKVIWNFVNADDVIIDTHEMTGMIVAPESEVHIRLSFNGTVIGNTVENHTESHRTDFAGRIVPTDHIDGAHIHVYKVDKANYGKFLQGATFALYEWDGSTWVIAQQNSENQIDITDNEGKVIFQNLKYNVAYKLVETKAPPGYRISTDAQFFYFENSDTDTYPVLKPEGFTASGDSDCILHYYPNESTEVEVTSLQVTKQWVSSQGGELPYNPWNSVEFEIWVTESQAVLDAEGNLTYGEDEKIVYGTPSEAVRYNEDTTYTLTAEENWTLTVKNLPVTSEDLLIRYDYSIKEVISENAGYTSAVTQNEDGSYTITNKVDVTAEYMPMAISKDWTLLSVDDYGDGTPVNIDSATFQLIQVSKLDLNSPWSSPKVINNNIRLDRENKWFWKAEDNTLPAQLTIGDVTIYYAYYVVETPVPDGYYPDYDDVSANSPVAQARTLEVTNVEIEYTDLTIQKQWLDKDKKPLESIDVESITVQIEQSSDGGATWALYGDPITISATDGWTHTVKDLPLQNVAGRTLSYRVTETPLEGYLSTGGDQVTNDTITLTNMQVETTSLTLKKVWKDSDGSDLSQPPVSSVQVQILQSSDGGVTWKDYGNPVTILAEENWSLTVTGLPVSNLEGEETPFQYQVKELNVSESYTSDVVLTADGVITITNTRETPSTELTVEKRWIYQGSEYSANGGSVQVKLYRTEGAVAQTAVSSDGMVNVSLKVGQYGDNDVYYTNKVTVPTGTWITIELCTPSSGYVLSLNGMYSGNTMTPSSVTQDGDSYIAVYRFQATEDMDLYGRTNHWNAEGCSASMTYTASGTLLDTVTLSVSNNWRHTFSNLPLYIYDESENIIGQYYYYVEEVDGAQYSVTYTDDNGNSVSSGNPVTGGTILVTNTVPEGGYVLPETGGSGTYLYTAGGLLLMAAALVLLYNNTVKRRKGEFSSS